MWLFELGYTLQRLLPLHGNFLTVLCRQRCHRVARRIERVNGIVVVRQRLRYGSLVASLKGFIGLIRNL